MNTYVRVSRGNGGKAHLLNLEWLPSAERHGRAPLQCGVHRGPFVVLESTREAEPCSACVKVTEPWPRIVDAPMMFSDLDAVIADRLEGVAAGEKS